MAVRDDELALDEDDARATSCSVGVPGAAKTEVAAANAASAKVFILKWFKILIDRNSNRERWLENRLMNCLGTVD